MYNILVVEDNEINRVITNHFLTEQGAKTENAENGAHALEQLNQSSVCFDLVLMDIQMPIMDGVEATKQIRKLRDPKLANIPIIALSANVMKDEVAEYLAVGMNAHCAKPIEMDSLLNTIQTLLKPNSSS